MHKTKIVCTIGPSSCNKETINGLINNGMNVCRLNLSHNSLQWHQRVIKTLRSIDKNIPILIDLPGRKVRTANFNKPYKLKKGEHLIFISDSQYSGEDKIPINYKYLHKDLKKGNIILADDGALKFEVLRIVGKEIHCLILSDGEIKGVKGLNVPYVRLNTPLVPDKDKELIRFAIKNKVDWVGISFVESAKHVREIKKLLRGSDVEIISKIENKFGIEKIDEIIETSSAILVDRGDLGAETSIEKIGILQKEIIQKANKYGKPVIIATEMLHSMIEKSQPTKAEVMDITNSIIDGASAIMLSGETAIGNDPVHTIKIMRGIADEVECHYQKYFDFDFSMEHKSIPNAIGKSIFEICKQMPITKVICVTLSGYSARMISRYRINQPVFAVTDVIEKSRRFNLLWGVEGLALGIKFKKKAYDHIIKIAKKLYKLEIINEKDLVIFTAVILPKKDNKMNYLQIHKIGDLAALLKWK